MEEKLLLIPWMVSVLYSSVPLFWFAIHPLAPRWRKMHGSPYKLLLPIWAAIIFVLAWVTWPWRGMQLYSSLWMWAPALLFLLPSVRTYAAIRSEFGAHKLSGEAEVRPDEHAQELVSTGMHSRMRHPIYVAHLSSFAGWAVGSGLLVAWTLLVASVVFTFPLMIWLEERELVARFGTRYREYQRRVPLMPNIFSWQGGKKTASSQFTRRKG
ncbi:MAG TPA: isoprenylcysteine carboxylmethyltransferase family protein, partial [Candidatus Angelobacter sp.]|nr:isoprenylcysteine carboxylmethyltransferase family protein [Candidatus Angelobacter sp.]